MYINKNLFAPHASDLLEKLAESLFYNFHRDNVSLKLKVKKLLQKKSSKTLTAGVFYFFLVRGRITGKKMWLLWARGHNVIVRGWVTGQIKCDCNLLENQPYQNW